MTYGDDKAQRVKRLAEKILPLLIDERSSEHDAIAAVRELFAREHLADRPDVMEICKRNNISPYATVERAQLGVGRYVMSETHELAWVAVARTIEDIVHPRPTLVEQMEQLKASAQRAAMFDVASAREFSGESMG